MRIRAKANVASGETMLDSHSWLDRSGGNVRSRALGRGPRQMKCKSIVLRIREYQALCGVFVCYACTLTRDSSQPLDASYREGNTKLRAAALLMRSNFSLRMYRGHEKLSGYRRMKARPRRRGFQQLFKSSATASSSPLYSSAFSRAYVCIGV